MEIQLATYKRTRNRLYFSVNFNVKKYIYISYFLSIITMKTHKVNINLPTVFGESVLGLSKILIYEFYYNYIIPKWSKRGQLSLYGY